MDVLYFGFGDVAHSIWPLFLIGLGFWLIVRRRRHQQQTWSNIQCESFEPSEAGSAKAEASAGPSDTGPKTRVSESPSRSESGKLKYNKVFGDMFIDCSCCDVRSVDVTTFIGDIEIRLHGARLAEGLNRMVLSGFIGDVRILVPADMPVYAQCSNFIGDIDLMGRRVSGFGNNLSSQTPNYAEADSKLYIASNHFIGDVRLYVV
jgi:predicted membrane protein